MTGVRVASVGFVFTAITEESGGTFAGEASDAIDAGAAVLARVRFTIVNVNFASIATKARVALAEKSPKRVISAVT